MLLRLFYVAAVLYLLASGARRRKIQVGPVAMVYYELGPRRPKTGETWLLLHGLGSVAASWDVVLRKMSRDCRLIVPELSALGGTVAPGDGLDVETACDVLIQLLDDRREELDGRPVTVAGISLGGWVAVRLALKRPDLVSRLVLINAGGYRDQDWDRIQSLVTVDDLPGVDRLYGAMFAQTPWIMRVSREGFLRAYTSNAVKNVLASLAEKDTFGDDDLARIQVPTGLIWGEKDGLFQVEAARAMAAALPDSHLYLVGECGHAVHLEKPRQLLQALQRFRREVPLASPRGAAGPVESRDDPQSAWREDHGRPGVPRLPGV